MKKLYSIFLISLTIVTLSCESERDCKCPMKDFASEQTISEEDLSSDKTDWSLEGTVGATIKKIVDVEIKGGFENEKYDISTSKVVSKINNEFPQFSNRTYEFKIGRLFFCAYYTILCNDTSIEETELREKSDKKLEEFKKEFYSSLNSSSERNDSSQKKEEKGTEEKTETPEIEMSKFSGTIEDSQSDLPIVGATIIYKGKEITVSKKSGTYFFELDLSGYTGEKISIQIVNDGYKPEEFYLDKEGQTKKIKLQKL